MKTETYICDICKKSVSQSDLTTLGVNLANIAIKSEGYPKRSCQFDICKDCLKKKGFVIENLSGEDHVAAANKNTKTLESKIIDILEDLGVAFCE